ARYTVFLLERSNKKFCTGVLIPRNIILPAAHCMNADPTQMTLAFGLHPQAGHYTARRSSKSISHPLYRKDDITRYDLALVYVDSGAPEKFSPLLLPDESFPLHEGLNFTAAGFGQNESQTSNALHFTELKITALDSTSGHLYVNQAAGKGICQGDSGGPALMSYQGRDYVVGVASALLPDSTEHPADLCRSTALYMNVQKFQGWIKTASKALLN
ncbi:MAG: trypsin-like serine protease, partial [Bdellovibrio sp.]